MKIKDQLLPLTLLVAGIVFWGCQCGKPVMDDVDDVEDVQESHPVQVEQPKPEEHQDEPLEILEPVKVERTPVKPSNFYGKVGIRQGDMLPKYHVLQKKLDDEISQRAWTNLVTFYDFDHSVFLQSDLDKFAARDRKLDDEIRAGNISFGFDVYNLYVKRLTERIDFATNLLAKGEWDFSVKDSYRIKRKDAPWPKTREEAEEHWLRRMKNEILVQLINKDLDAAEKAAKEKKSGKKKDKASNSSTNSVEKADTPEQSLIKKYRQYVTVMTEPDEETVLQHYLSAVCRAYDPHTDYMAPATKEDFDMDMSLTLCGVGAVLSMDDGALKIVEVMPGGPVDRDGRIKEGDKIVGVKQGDGEMEDVMWQPMKKSIRKIRGKKGTRVTLDIIPRSDPSGTTKKQIELVRDEIKLEDQAATGRVERVTLNGHTSKIGYIYLPGFYGTMDKKPGEEGFRSCSMDVARYIADFNAEDVDGLVLDLRGNGGGSLREAVMLSALFVPQGPVVQIRDIRTVGCLPIPPGNPVAFKKPMIVMTDRASASASEIVAGHLQDTGRAVIVGDNRTHGKGTVQTVMGLGPDKYGSCKITTARFYRIDGRSTQVEGVGADIHLPSLLDSLDIGEDKLPNALPFSRIAPADYALCWNMHKYVPALKAASEKRLKDNERYIKHIANVKGMKEISEREEVSLERSVRKLQMAADRELRELDDAETEDDDEETASKKRRKRNERKKDDVILDETFNVLMDLIRMNGGELIPTPKVWWM